MTLEVGRRSQVAALEIALLPRLCQQDIPLLVEAREFSNQDAAVGERDAQEPVEKLADARAC